MAEINAKTVCLKANEMVKIRSARPEDAESILLLTQSVFQESEFTLTTAEEFSLTIEGEAEWIKENQSDPDKLLIVAEADQQIV
ncbi:GNAT family N-acetyltransferase [Paenactinomyces guangxiensis]|uniref:Uncharacterized protein n=1 Tax=Paenactinomyces guangxiensis TaxID=1490290 RepID=A0A7W1WS14_9BACL|nr:hypothetical protein [Paenactinomyces guangxiensis]MBA4494908.1 hypothetical protein [Paenactinomyces guangxiensis]MBH8591991.1 hypothetical protein [Paenactinomyces guangxiensis]